MATTHLTLAWLAVSVLGAEATADPATATTQPSLSQYGITWTFAEPARTGSIHHRRLVGRGPGDGSQREPGPYGRPARIGRESGCRRQAGL